MFASTHVKFDTHQTDLHVKIHTKYRNVNTDTYDNDFYGNNDTHQTDLHVNIEYTPNILM